MMYDADEITKRIADALKNSTSKIEGTFTMDNIQAVAQELSRIYYMDIMTIPDKYFLDTAMTEYLDRRALDFNETRNPSTYATGYADFKGVVGTSIPKGVGVQSETLTFLTDKPAVLDSEGKARVPVTCTMFGNVGNISIGGIKNIRIADTINGLTVSNSTAFAGGVDEETDEAFRSRILEKIRKPYTSGNINDYVRWSKQISGVGNAICIPCWSGAGTVKVIILSSDGGVPDDVVIQRVKEHIASNRPIGADVTVSKAVPKDISIICNVKLDIGYQTSDVMLEFKAILQEYLTDKAFGDDKQLSYFKISDLLYNCQGVYDVLDYTINGTKTSINATADEFFRLLEVVINVTR